MLRHLKNANELTLYASLSCGAAFLGRLLPPFYFPILLLRLGIFAYCFYVIYKAEGNKELALIVGASLFIGMIGGYWDYIEILLRYDLSSIVRSITIILMFIVAVAIIILQVKYGKSK